MYCFQLSIPQELCDIDDERKAIYHSQDSVCIWVLSSVADRNRFVQETAGMKKAERENHYLQHYAHIDE